MKETAAPVIAPMKQSTRMILVGILTILTIVIAGEISDAIGVAFGLEQLGLAGITGIIGSLKLLAS